MDRRKLQITLGGTWAIIHDDVAELMKRGWQIDEFVSTGAYCTLKLTNESGNDAKRIEYPGLSDLRKQTADGDGKNGEAVRPLLPR